jgi:hypothetical protein
MNFE